MTKRVVKQTSTGAVVEYTESPAERRERLFSASSKRFVRVTPGQIRDLQRVKARKAAAVRRST
jgi:hypothetical protein